MPTAARRFSIGTQTFEVGDEVPPATAKVVAPFERFLTDPAPAEPTSSAEPDEDTQGVDLDALDKAALVDLAEDFGIDVNSRWSVSRLRDEIIAANNPQPADESATEQE